jgi:nitrate reductase NapE component
MTTKTNAGISRRRKKQSGTEFIEFALSALVLFPLMISVVIVGLNLGRSIQVAQVCRDAGSMYVRGIDFSQTANKNELVRLANGMGMTVGGGTGVVILSKVQFISAAMCTGIAGCNSNKYVVVQRLTIGNPSVTTSRLGPAGAITTDSSGNVTNFMTDPNAVSANFTTIMTLAANEYAFVSEASFLSPDLTTLGGSASTGVYARSVY